MSAIPSTPTTPSTPISPLSIKQSPSSEPAFGEYETAFEWAKSDASLSLDIDPTIPAFEDLCQPLSPVMLGTDALVNTIVNISSQLTAAKTQLQAVEEENQRLKLTIQNFEINAPKIDALLTCLRQIAGKVEQNDKFQASLSASQDEITQLRSRLIEQQRLNYSVERELESTPLCYQCHENRKVMRWGTGAGLSYDENEYEDEETRRPRKKAKWASAGSYY